MTPAEKSDIIDKQSQYLERLFQAGIIPADTVLTGVRNAQNDMGVASSITDDDVTAMKGKYLKDISPQADPYGGIFQGGEGEQENTEETTVNLPSDADSENPQTETPQTENIQ
mgnify:CR=1 FL=1